MSNIIRIVCAWCGADLGTKHADNLPAGSVSHGICKPCADKLVPAKPQPSSPLRGLATGRVDPATRQIVITPCDPCDPDGLDLAGAWGQEDGISGTSPAGALHFTGQALDAYDAAYSRGAQMRTRFWGG